MIKVRGTHVFRRTLELYLVEDGDGISFELVMQEYPSIRYPKGREVLVHRRRPRDAVLAAWDLMIESQATGPVMPEVSDTAGARIED